MIAANENGPALWAKILQPIQATLGSGVIAGGAVRDHLLGVDAKDIDVFVDVQSAETLTDAIPALEALGFSFALMDHAEYEHAPDWVTAVRGVLDGLFGDVPVQVIARPTVGFCGEKVVANFDFAITQCWFDGELHDTPAAAKDRASKVVTLTRWNSAEHVEVSRDRFAHFNDRHGGAYAWFDAKPDAFIYDLSGAF